MKALHTFALAGALCIGITPVPAASVDIEAARVVIKGQTSKLALFDQTLRAVLHPTDPGDAGILCYNCDDLPANAPTALYYVIYRSESNMAAFTAAWGKLQAQGPDYDLTLLFDMSYPWPDCSQFRPPCYSAPYCATTCDTNRSPPCQACTPR